MLDMYVLLFFVAIIVIYVKSFQDNFTKEKIDKVAPMLLLLVIVAILMLIVNVIIAR